MALDHQTAVDLVVLGGSALGATGAGLLPYWAKVRQNAALGLPPITFDKMFVGTIAMAFVIGIAFAFATYSTSLASVDPNATLVTVFVISAGTAFIANKGINGSLSVPSTTQAAALYKAQNEVLKDEINNLKAQKTPEKTTIEDSAPIGDILVNSDTKSKQPIA